MYTHLSVNINRDSIAAVRFLPFASMSRNCVSSSTMWYIREERQDFESYKLLWYFIGDKIRLGKLAKFSSLCSCFFDKGRAETSTSYR